MVLSAALIDWLAHSPGYQTKALGRLFSASFPRSATGCPRLRYLSLDCCVSVTDQALWYLLQHNPNVQVLLSFVSLSYPKLGSGLLGATRKVLKVLNLKKYCLERVALTACRRRQGIENIALDRMVRLGQVRVGLRFKDFPTVGLRSFLVAPFALSTSSTVSAEQTNKTRIFCIFAIFQSCVKSSVFKFSVCLSDTLSNRRQLYGKMINRTRTP